ncbi:hypothetical protein TNIN_379251 [Trichonephila inaurata madagascariensis]|uniref:Uncharacterized protein n=1 Tax=Trichonephila inaurata madagascariensis TaxID=2747483 RepID=A0A8X6IYY2_9ARAC|nr:hypothetical protein TNIN_379251 [Trichonephila inaurata madagascariensis]
MLPHFATLSFHEIPMRPCRESVFFFSVEGYPCAGPPTLPFANEDQGQVVTGEGDHYSSRTYLPMGSFQITVVHKQEILARGTPGLKTTKVVPKINCTDITLKANSQASIRLEAITSSSRTLALQKGAL